MDLGVEHREQWRKGARLVLLFYSFNSFGFFVFWLFLRSTMQFPNKSLIKGLSPSYNCPASLWHLDQSHLGMKGLHFSTVLWVPSLKKDSEGTQTVQECGDRSCLLPETTGPYVTQSKWLEHHTHITSQENVLYRDLPIAQLKEAYSQLRSVFPQITPACINLT